jgi:hypothetical protein
MRAQPWFAAVLVVASCGGESAPAEAPAESPGEPASNQAPQVDAAQITPAAPSVGDELTVESSVTDPEGDPVRVRVEWFVNRELQPGTGASLETDELQRGDEVYAVVRASDGNLEGVGQTAHVYLGNSPPRVTALTVRPERPDASQTLVAEVAVEDRDGDAAEVHFEWIVNGKPIAGATSATLEPGHVKRGDRLRVIVRPTDSDPGEAFESPEILVANARPQIVSKPVFELAGDDRYEYQISATDPDGDRPLRYALVSGPDGMQVDLVSGLVEWSVPSDAEGKFPIEIAVRDSHGAESRQSYALEFRLETVEKKKSSRPASSDDD